ncbi:MAG TPA: DUF4900 domain-containing protein [Trueperaceae bacterium]|nr:DUF4900 domain-containing protein [Trueperaceae bacterium]
MQLRKKGIALVASLALLVVTAGVLALIFSSTMRDINQGVNDAAIIKSLMLARGGATLGAKILQGPIKGELNTIVQDTANTVGVWQFGQSSLGSANMNPTPESVMSDLGMVAQLLQPKIDALLCNQAISPNGSSSLVTVHVFVTDTACGNISLPNKVKLQGGRFIEGAGRTYSIPYVMVSEAVVGSYRRNIVVQGEYQFRVGGDKFAKFALFTNEHNASNGTDIWFTGDTLFEGPVHTNGHFRFYKDPWFGGQVTSAGFSNPQVVNVPDPQNPPSGDNPGANYWNAGFHNAAELATSTSYTGSGGTVTSPTLAGGVDWNSSYIKLPDNAFDQQIIASQNGIDISGSVHSIKMWAADSAGNPLVSDGSGGWNPAATYQYIKVCETENSCVIYRYGNDLKLYKNSGSGFVLENPNFKGVVYSSGSIDRLKGPSRVPSTSTNPDDAPPAIASFAQLTVVAQNDVRITGDLKYEDPPCTGYPERQADNSVTPSVCNNINARNILGVFTPNGDILIGNNHGGYSDTINNLDAPDNLAIHGSFMASSGIVTVEDFGQGVPRGDVNLLGGIIENNYGAFGTFNGATGDFSTGFSRKFAYDTRLSMQMAPPYFPGTDKATVEGVFTFSLGQREQVY